ncbi:M48 family metallopeptidase [Venatoribacter cucullus]|uniref:M48 family metallopeptidase n=1 Tax=Venatoribacter cucullus TaxID=2661630 RepID=UPI00223FD6CC|nr:M48 family metallopeptidase [Venatoribacter cucullus]UZK04642.1 M48 family metalloprotease [Venatoribacter cucullus]
MDFFSHQDQARKRTTQLVLLFVAAVASLIVALNLLIAVLFMSNDQHSSGRLLDYVTVEQWLWISAGVITVIGGASLVKWLLLRGGGRVVAESLGGRLLLPNTQDFYERRLLNIVEEMALAAGMPVPPVYVLSDHSINAFAAGYQPSDAVIGVTQGCMEQLSRDQLQGVVAHEFSHILNGDMRLNIRLMAVLFGLLFIALIGRFMLEASARGSRVRSSNKNNGAGAFMLLGAGLVVIGYTGVLFGNLIKAAVSRQREFLADASAVQFTRNPASISGALKVIGYGSGSEISSPEREETAHLFFGQAIPFRMQLFATHPPLIERIRRVEPRWDGLFLPPQTRKAAEQESPSAVSKASQMAGVTALAGAAMAAAAIPAVTSTASQQEGPDPARLWQELVETAHDSYQVRALICCLLIVDPRRLAYDLQIDWLQVEHGQDFHRQVLRLLPLTQKLRPEQRLPLVERAMPALKQLSAPQYQDFRQTLMQLAKADGEIDIFEWCLYRLILQYLNPHFGEVRPLAARYSAVKDIRDETATVLSVLVRFGHDTGEAAAQAFDKACTAAGFTGLQLQPRSNSLKPLNLALSKLSEAYPHLKGRLIKAMQAAIHSDGELRPVELDLVRTIAAIMEVPVALD